MNRRKRTMMFIILGFVGVLLAFSATVVVLGRRMIQDVYEKKITELSEVIEANKYTVYRAKRDILAGEVITDELVSAREELTGDAYGLFGADDIGKYALLDIPARTVLNTCLVTEKVIENDSRYVEYSCFHISSNIRSGDVIDVRIRYRNGEDFVVLSKKTAEMVSYNTSTCFLSVGEKEQLYMASAIHDSAAYNAVLYALLYEAPTEQKASKVTYIPSTNLAKIVFGDRLDQNGIVYDDYGYIEYQTKDRLELEARLSGSTYAGDISNVMGTKKGEQANTNGNGNSISSGFVVPGVSADNGDDSNDRTSP